jgi:hypothetical protein
MLPYRRRRPVAVPHDDRSFDLSARTAKDTARHRTNCGVLVFVVVSDHHIGPLSISDQAAVQHLHVPRCAVVAPSLATLLTKAPFDAISFWNIANCGRSISDILYTIVNIN